MTPAQAAQPAVQTSVTRRPWVPALLVFVSCIVFSSLFVHNVERLRAQRAELQARQLASAIAHDFGERLDRSLSASYALATLVRQGRGKVDNFETLATEMLGIYGGISALQLAPEGVIRQVVPLKGNESVIGFSPLNDPKQRAEARRVIEQRRLGLTGPFELRQGGVGVVGRHPIFLPDENGKEQFWGLTQVVIRIPDLLAATRIDALTEAGYAYELWRMRPDDHTRHVFARNTGAVLVSPVDERIAVPNGEWVLSVAPLAGWSSLAQTSLEWIAAFVFSALVTLAVYLLMRQPLLLRDEVARRTAELQESENKYRVLFHGNPVPVLVYDFETLKFLDANEAFLKAYGYSHDELLGMSLADVYADDAERERLHAFLSNVAAKGYVNAGLWRYRRRDGQVVDVEITSHGLDYLGHSARLALVADVSLRRAAEEQLRKHNLWLQSILEHFPGGVSVTDSQQRVVTWNTKFRELLQFPDEMFVGEPRHLIDFVRCNAERGEYGDVDVDAYVAQMAERINLHEPHHFERTRPNGSVLDVRGTPLPDGGFVSSYVDITEQKQAEMRLRQSEQRFRDLFERSPDPCWIIEGNLFVDCNLAAVDILGYVSREELLSTHPSRLSPDVQPDGRASFEKAEEMMSTAYSQGVHRFEWEHRRHDDSCFPVEVTLARIDLHGQEVLYCVWRDITERKQAERALLTANRRYERLNAELEERVAERTRLLETEVADRRAAEAAVRQSARWLREIIDTLSSGIVLWDRERRLMAWNAAFERMFPAAAPHMKAGVVRDELKSMLEGVGALSLRDADSGDWNRFGRWDRPLPDGRIIAVERLPTSEGGRLVLHTDVTAQIKTAEVLARNERMASLGNLVAGIAHEINTPIGNALMVSSSIGDRLGEFESALATGALRRSTLEGFLASIRESDDLLERNLQRAANLIQNFKQVAVDQTSDQRRDFDLATVFEEVRMTLVPRLRRTSCKFEVDTEVGVAMDSYPGAIGQIVTNLVENALLHAFEGREDGQLTLVARQVGESVEVLFSDDGNGIPPEVLPRIFDPFFTTRLGRGGSGLGLSIVLNLVRDLLGGEMHVDSHVGQGTQFRIVFPKKAPPARQAPAAA